MVLGASPTGLHEVHPSHAVALSHASLDATGRAMMPRIAVCGPCCLQLSRIRFCTSRDGTRIAYAICGSGPMLMRAPHWMSSINLEWDSPVWRHWLTLLARHHTLIQFDQRGCGLSDREGVEFSFEKFAEDFEAVIEAASLDRFDLFAFSGGAMTGIAYAARHPHRVNQFVICSSTAYGPLSAAAALWLAVDFPLSQLTTGLEASGRDDQRVSSCLSRPHHGSVV